MISLALAAGIAAGTQAAAPAPADPTPLEHALVDYRCRSTQPGTYAYQVCYEEHLPKLRADFGADLGRLAPADRRAINAVCGEPSAAAGRDAYLGCLDAQLTAVRLRLTGAGAGASTPTAESGAHTEPAPAPAPPVDPAPVSAASAPAVWLIGGVVAIVGLGAVGAAVALRARRPVAVAVKCRSCGGDASGAGDLCAPCRHEAAETRRRAAAERAAEPAVESVDPARRLAEEQAELERREQERRELEDRRHAEDETRRREELERRQRIAEERGRQEAAAGAVFDPYAVLGIDPGSTGDAIAAAYQRARARYAPGEYEHLGAEVQDHFKAKAEAVERAYRMLTGAA